MKSTHGRTIVLLILLAVTFMLLGIYSYREYRLGTVREAQTRLLQQHLQTADAIVDDRAAVAAYKKLQPALPEIQLRILQRQWRIALEQMHYLQRARFNTELQDKTEEYGTRLTTLLDEMQDRCGSMLTDTASLRADMVWQVHNAAGSAKILSALVMLENEQNADKVQGIMRDALISFKAAIEAVDQANVPPLQKNIPRWNLELLNGEEYVKKIEVAMTDMEKNQVLKENLETLLPEMGGYAPGEPIETKIEK
ncbi:MAG: hypothetical protein AB9919_03050 [Geobacteraceae bacterium]